MLGGLASLQKECGGLSTVELATTSLGAVNSPVLHLYCTSCEPCRATP